MDAVLSETVAEVQRSDLRESQPFKTVMKTKRCSWWKVNREVKRRIMVDLTFGMIHVVVMDPTGLRWSID